MSLRFVALVGLLSALTLVVGPAAGAGPTAVGAGQSDASQPPGADPSNALAAVPQSDAEKKAAEKEKAATTDLQSVPREENHNAFVPITVCTPCIAKTGTAKEEMPARQNGYSHG